MTVFPPWDLLRGRDVFRDRTCLDREDQLAQLMHFAPNCATFSRAREIPLPNVKNPPIPLRSDTFPTGIPSELAKLSHKARKRLEADTEMAVMAAERCLVRHRAGRLFSLEHPGRSIALELPEWAKLREEPGVFCSFYHTCMFEGSRRRKFQVLIHNLPELRGIEKLCESAGRCDRTGAPHEKWRPLVANGRVQQFVTGEEREYPVGFCSAYAGLLRESLDSFAEIFSGPNAPLSDAVSRRFKGTGVPRSQPTPVVREAQSSDSFPRPKGLEQPTGIETVANRRIALASGRQPSFGKRTQMISDGLNCPSKHLQRAVVLEHPFAATDALKSSHREIFAPGLDPDELFTFRVSQLALLRSLKHDPAVRRRDRELRELCGRGAKKLGPKMDLGLMERVQETLGIVDKAVPLLCATGMPIIGEALCSPFFDMDEGVQKVTMQEFLGTCKRRRQDALRRTAFMARQGGVEMARALHAKNLGEVHGGTMGPKMSLEQVVSKFGDHFNLIPSFGLKQGLNSKGEPKYRRIDDHTAGWVNLAAKRKQKIQMANADYIALMVKALGESQPGEPVTIGTADMKAAYRQIALSDESAPFSLTCLYDPEAEDVGIHEMYGQPFGAGHAVPNFYRVAEWFSRFAAGWFHMGVDHFFDDPSQAAEVLGVVFDTSRVADDRVLIITPKPSRIANLCSLIDGILATDTLTSGQAASVIGKFGFLCSTLYGKVGRCATHALRARQYSISSDSSLTPPLRTSLRLIQTFTTNCPPRQIRLGSEQKPLILYTDASDVPERMPRYGLGAVLIDPSGSSPRMEHFQWEVPTSLVALWLPRATYMGQLEILAGPVALATWRHRLQDRRIIHFVDNDAASACLVRGYSPKSDSCSLVGEYWLTAAHHRVEPYIERVESKSNLADEPSRFSATLLFSMGSTAVEPHVPDTLLRGPGSWFEPG